MCGHVDVWVGFFCYFVVFWVFFFFGVFFCVVFWIVFVFGVVVLLFRVFRRIG